MENPLLAAYTTPYGAYPFDTFKEEDYIPAFTEGIAEKKALVDSIINNPDTPTFDNTLIPLERGSEKLEKVSNVFFNLLHSNSTDGLQEISQQIMPMLTELGNYISLSQPLFDRIKNVYERQDEFSLDEEDRRILKETYDGFKDSGALLPDEEKKKLERLSLEQSKLTLTYGQNVLRDEQTYTLHLTDSADVAGMPETVLGMARHRAEEKADGKGWLFDLSAPSYFPFLQHNPHSRLRKEMYLAKMSVGAKNDDYNNEQNIIDIVNNRLASAKMLGYETFAHLALHDRMAKKPGAVYQLLDELLEAYKPVGEKELEIIRSYAAENGHQGELMAWDWSYWAEQYRQTHYELDDEMLRPYFKLENVIDGVFGLATRLYGITFKRNESIPVYHKDVKVYEVQDEDGSYLGLLYTDFFPRKGKKSGAWMNGLQDQYIDRNGEDHRPHIVLVMNFTPPTAEKPSLLTPGEVRTFLHEFGHALHGMLTHCKYASISGTSVARDFVELPSQLMENWLTEREWLDSFACHYQTGEKIPAVLIDKMLAARHFLVGYAACRQLSFGYLDMAYHTRTEPLPKEIRVKTFEEEAWAKALLLPPSPEGTMMSTAFNHIFSGGYASGYYGYKWAEVLDADAFGYFQEKGLFSREVANRFRHEVLEQGDKREAMELYEAFRGRKPTIQALLKRDGLTD